MVFTESVKIECAIKLNEEEAKSIEYVNNLKVDRFVNGVGIILHYCMSSTYPISITTVNPLTLVNKKILRGYEYKYKWAIAINENYSSDVRSISSKIFDWKIIGNNEERIIAHDAFEKFVKNAVAEYRAHLKTQQKKTEQEISLSKLEDNLKSQITMSIEENPKFKNTYIIKFNKSVFIKNSIFSTNLETPSYFHIKSLAFIKICEAKCTDQCISAFQVIVEDGISKETIMADMRTIVDDKIRSYVEDLTEMSM